MIDRWIADDGWIYGCWMGEGWLDGWMLDDSWRIDIRWIEDG